MVENTIFRRCDDCLETPEIAACFLFGIIFALAAFVISQIVREEADIWRGERYGGIDALAAVMFLCIGSVFGYGLVLLIKRCNPRDTDYDGNYLSDDSDDEEAYEEELNQLRASEVYTSI